MLYSVLPISVANELRHSRPVPARRYDCVTLLFSGIVGFGAYCAAHTDSSGAMKIVNMLNQLYIHFDVLTDPKKNPNVYKVIIIQLLIKIYHCKIFTEWMPSKFGVNAEWILLGVKFTLNWNLFQYLNYKSESMRILKKF